MRVRSAMKATPQRVMKVTGTVAGVDERWPRSEIKAPIQQ
jgi:hypothetical protein